MADVRPDGAKFGEFVSRLSPAIREAARVARFLEGAVENTPKLDESSVVKQALTLGDTACQETLLEALFEHYPEVCLAAEEDTQSVARFPSSARAQVVVDPIDGTLHSYLEGRGPYAVILGLLLDGVYEAGLIALPREGLFFDAQRGGGAQRGAFGRSTTSARPDPDGGRILVSHGTPPAVSDWLRDQGVEVVPASGGAVAVAPLIPGVRAGLRCNSSPQSISIRGRVGALISREAGARVCGAGRSDFPVDAETPASVLMVASREADLDLLDQALSHDDRATGS